MPGKRIVLITAAALVAATSVALAAPPQPPADHRFELQPFVGYRLGGSFDLDAPEATGLDIESSLSYGFTIGWLLNASQQIDFRWSRQDTDLDILGSLPGLGDHLSGFSVDNYLIEGSYIMGATDDSVRGFVSFGVGATRFSAPDGFDGSETKLAASIGGGAKITLGKSIGLRLEGRWIPTFFNSEQAIFCSSNNGCIASARGDLVSQAEVTTGLVVCF